MKRRSGSLAHSRGDTTGSDYLTAEEIDLVRGVLLRRTEQVAFHVMERSKIHHVPYDSHAVRSLSSVLVPACIAMRMKRPRHRHGWITRWNTTPASIRLGAEKMEAGPRGRSIGQPAWRL